MESTFQEYRPLISGLFYTAGILVLVLCRKPLLYEGSHLSLGRVWGWTAFFLAGMFWLKYLLGVIPPDTEFPPFLDQFLYAALIYEFSKKGSKTVEMIADVWSSRRFGSGGQDKGGQGDGNWDSTNDDDKPKRLNEGE